MIERKCKHFIWKQIEFEIVIFIVLQFWTISVKWLVLTIIMSLQQTTRESRGDKNRFQILLYLRTDVERQLKQYIFLQMNNKGKFKYLNEGSLVSFPP